jgi:hypothetical protein
LVALTLGLCGCEDRAARSTPPTTATESAVQAEAARKEMDALPKAFQTPDYFKKNDPAPGPAPSVPEKK